MAMIYLQHGCNENDFASHYDLLLSKEPVRVLAELGKKSSIMNIYDAEREYIRGLSYLLLTDNLNALNCFKFCIESGYYSEYIYFNMGNSLRNLNLLQESIAYYDKALEINSTFCECRHNRALSLADIGEINQAITSLRLLLVDEPSYTKASFALGNILREEGLLEEAIQCYKISINNNPYYVDAFNNLGICYKDKKDDLTANIYFRLGLSIDSCNVNCLINLVQVLVRQRKHLDAIPEVKKLLTLDLTHAKYANCVQTYLSILLETGQIDTASCFVKSYSSILIQNLLCLHLLPPVYKSGEDIESTRKLFSTCLNSLVEYSERIEESDPLYEILFAHCWLLTNFYLAYQMDNDRAMQKSLSYFTQNVLRHRLGNFMSLFEPKIGAERKPRVGFISVYLHNHNGCFWSLPLFRALYNSGDFELFAYNLGEEQDAVTAEFARLGTYRHYPLNAVNAEKVFQQIRDDQLAFLFFTDVGMHPASRIAALMRLARVQAVGWGHPITTGSAAIDYFFSGEGMETEESQQFYTERLQLLPNTGLCYDPPLIEETSPDLLKKLDLPEDRPLLLSLQSTFKYHPAHDYLYASISKNNPDALLVMVEHMGHPLVSQRLLERLASSYRKLGLDINNHIRLLPRLSYNDFVGLFAVAHHALDTPDWNGGNSSFQAFAQACPVVTWPGRFMRGRHTVAMLKVMGINELIAKDAESYVEISTRLLRDEEFASAMRSKIRANAPRLFQDKEVADAFVAITRRLCQQQSAE